MENAAQLELEMPFLCSHKCFPSTPPLTLNNAQSLCLHHHCPFSTSFSPPLIGRSPPGPSLAEEKGALSLPKTLPSLQTFQTSIRPFLPHLPQSFSSRPFLYCQMEEEPVMWGPRCKQTSHFFFLSRASLPFVSFLINQTQNQSSSSPCRESPL